MLVLKKGKVLFSPEQLYRERAIVDSFGHLVHLNALHILKVRYRATHVENPIIPSSAQVEWGNRALQKLAILSLAANTKKRATYSDGVGVNVWNLAR